MASQTVGGVTENRYYIGNIYEEKEKNDTITKINYIFAGGKAIAIFETKAQGDSTLLFIHHDQLGSINAYSDVNGILVQELSYDAWGRRRNPETWAYYTDIIDAGAWDSHGFTGHEHIDLFEVVNMDGRMYDPVIGRFLSPDPIIQSPDFSQSLNRYAYCLNNPLSLVDPSGYSWFSKNWKSLVAAAVGITVTALTGNLYAGAKGIEAAVGAMVAGAAGGAAGAMTGALLNGCNLGQVAKATFTGAFWGGVSGFLNNAAGGGTFLEQLFKHSFTDAWLEGIQGGNALHGLISGALNTAGNTAIYSKQGLGDIGKIAASAVLGGTVAEIGGGKFANGAITAAYSMMFNDMMHPDNKDKKTTKKSSNKDSSKGVAAELILTGAVMLGDDATVIGVADDPVALLFLSAGTIIGIAEYGPIILDTTIDWLNDSYEYLKTYKEHSTNRNKANENKHQYGKARKKRDKNGGEKGDKRRKRYK